MSDLVNAISGGNKQLENDLMSPHHGGVSYRPRPIGTIMKISDLPPTFTPTPILPPRPTVTTNFTPASAPPPEDGTLKPPSILPVVFGAGLAFLFIYYNKNANLTFNFR